MVTGFLGPNGSGTSTTMRMIMGLDSPDSGSALIAGQPYAELAWPLHEVGALLGDPGVLLFDEPVNGLDPEGIRWVRTVLPRLAGEGRTVHVSSHLISEMALTADRLVVIGRGRLISETTVADFLARRGLRIHELAPVTASLEDAFMELTKDEVEHRPTTPAGAAGAKGEEWR